MPIRDLSWPDMPALVESYLALYDEVRENPDLGIGLFPSRPSLGEEAEWFAGLFKRVQDGSSVAAVAEENGRAVGLCTVNPKGPQQEGRHIGVLGIMVSRPHRGRGFGKALLGYVIDACRGKFEQIELSVFVSNATARDLYKSVGFKPWGVEPKAILRDGNYTDLEHMALFLR